MLLQRSGSGKPGTSGRTPTRAACSSGRRSAGGGGRSRAARPGRAGHRARRAGGGAARPAARRLVVTRPCRCRRTIGRARACDHPAGACVRISRRARAGSEDLRLSSARGLPDAMLLFVVSTLAGLHFPFRPARTSSRRRACSGSPCLHGAPWARAGRGARAGGGALDGLGLAPWDRRAIWLGKWLAALSSSLRSPSSRSRRSPPSSPASTAGNRGGWRWRTSASRGRALLAAWTPPP